MILLWFNMKVIFWFYKSEIQTHDVWYYIDIVIYIFSMMNEHLILDILYNHHIAVFYEKLWGNINIYIIWLHVH